MKQLSGKWLISPAKISALLASTSQVINHKIGNENYSALSIDASNDSIKCYKDVWTSKTNNPIEIKLTAEDKYHITEKSVDIRYAYPIYYGQLDKNSDFEINENFNKELLPCANIEISSMNVHENNYLYICIPTVYDNNQLLFLINDALGGIDLHKTQKLPVHDYIEVEYNIYRSTNHSLGKLHIIVSEKGLNHECLFI